MAASEPPFPDLAAMEFALGLLDADERAAARRRLLADPAFASETGEWRSRFDTLFAGWPEVAPPADLGARIETALKRETDAPTALRRWRAAAAAAMAIAASLLLVILLRPGAPTAVRDRPQIASPAPAPQLFLAVLTPKETAPIPAVYDALRGQVRLAAGGEIPADRSAQLWIIPDDGTPRPLGLLRRDAPTEVTIARAERALLAPGATLAISIEPVGGSPTGLPTGPVVATGALLRT